MSSREAFEHYATSFYRPPDPAPSTASEAFKWAYLELEDDEWIDEWHESDEFCATTTTSYLPRTPLNLRDPEPISEVTYSEGFLDNPFIDDADGWNVEDVPIHGDCDMPWRKELDPEFDHVAYMAPLVNEWKEAVANGRSRIVRVSLIADSVRVMGTGFLHPALHPGSALAILPDEIGDDHAKIRFAEDLVRAGLVLSRERALLDQAAAERVVPFGLQLARQLEQTDLASERLQRSASHLALVYIKQLKPLVTKAIRQHAGVLDPEEELQVRSEVRVQIFRSLRDQFDLTHAAYSGVASHLRRRIYGAVADYSRRHGPLDLQSYKLLQKLRQAQKDYEARYGREASLLKAAHHTLRYMNPDDINRLVAGLERGTRIDSLDRAYESGRSRSLVTVGEVMVDPKTADNELTQEDYDAIEVAFSTWSDYLSAQNGQAGPIPKPEQLSIAFAHYVQGYRYTEIATHFDLPEKDVRNVCLKFLSFCQRTNILEG